MKIDNIFENNEINTAFDFKGAHVGIINFYNSDHYTNYFDYTYNFYIGYTYKSD